MPDAFGGYNFIRGDVPYAADIIHYQAIIGQDNDLQDIFFLWDVGRSNSKEI
jgi:hypothetical protein